MEIMRSLETVKKTNKTKKTALFFSCYSRASSFPLIAKANLALGQNAYWENNMRLVHCVFLWFPLTSLGRTSDAAFWWQ